LLISDAEILDAIGKKEIEIKKFSKDQLEPASYDMRLGDKAIVSRTIKLEEFKKEVEAEEVKEINVKDAGSITIPPGAFALLTTLESIKLTRRYAGHIGMRSYYSRKGLILLSGLQIDPGFEGVLVLGTCNLSPRSITIEYGDSLCTVEIHKLSREASKSYSGEAMEAQKEGRIPSADKDYLRTVETMSVSDLTEALLTLSNNVNTLTSNIRWLWIPVLLTFLAVILTKVI